MFITLKNAGAKYYNINLGACTHKPECKAKCYDIAQATSKSKSRVDDLRRRGGGGGAHYNFLSYSLRTTHLERSCLVVGWKYL